MSTSLRQPTFLPATAPAVDPVVHALVQRASQAHAALMRGDLARYRSLLPMSADFSLMSPFGGPPTRPMDLSEEGWESIGRFFRNGRDSTLEVVHACHSDDMVVLAAVERTHVEVGGLAGQPWALRVTLVFRREHGQWLLAHRHADPLREGIGVEQSAALARGRWAP